MPDWLWERIEPLLPEPPPHPLGCHRARVPNRDAMDAILLVLRTGMQWNALNLTGPCSSSSAHRRFQGWERAGVFHEIWRRGLLDYDEQVGIDWSWLAADGAMTKAPLGGAKTGPNPTDRAKKGRSVRFSRRSPVCRSGGPTRAPTATHQKLLAETIESIPIERPKPTPQAPQGLCLDRAYDAPSMHELATEHGFTPHIRTRGEELADKLRRPGWRARRWVVEACHSWLNRNRAILTRWSKKGPKPPRPTPTRQRPDRLQEGTRRPPRRPTGIGPYSTSCFSSARRAWRSKVRKASTRPCTRRCP